MTTAYCQVVCQELSLRLPSILPWRPGVFRKARIGIHLDPATLELCVVGNDGKVAQNTDGSVRRAEATIPSLEYFEDREEIDHLVDVLRAQLDLAQPWRWANPTKTGLRQRAEAGARGRSWKEHLFLSRNGTPWVDSGTFAAAFRGALERGTKLVNSTLGAEEEPVQLPSGYGSRASYIMRFLWGHRAIAAGATFAEVAQVLGNSEKTVRRHYQDVLPTEAMNRVIVKVRDGHVAPQPAGRTPDEELLWERARANALEAELDTIRKALALLQGGVRTGAAHT